MDRLTPRQSAGRRRHVLQAGLSTLTQDAHTHQGRSLAVPSLAMDFATSLVRAIPIAPIRVSRTAGRSPIGVAAIPPSEMSAPAWRLGRSRAAAPPRGTPDRPRSNLPTQRQVWSGVAAQVDGRRGSTVTLHMTETVNGTDVGGLTMT